MFSLNHTIDPAADADEDDVINTKTALSRLGFFRGPIDPFPTNDMIDGVARFQEASGLKKDGVMKKDGPTAQKLGVQLTRLKKNEGEAGNQKNDNAPIWKAR